MTSQNSTSNVSRGRTGRLRRGGLGRGLVALCLLALVGGCTAEPPQFSANLVDLKMQELQTGVPVPADKRQQVADTLLALFGTPDDPDPFGKPDSKQPSLLTKFGFDMEKLRIAAGRVYSDESGVQHGLFRLHCAHCHGITGDGDGPTAAFLNPYPRDYREGKFKFKSTVGPEEPTRADLMRTITEGIPGTEMPTFRILSENERSALVEYVRYLSFRGQTEIALNTVVAGGDEIPAPALLVGGFPLVVDKVSMASQDPQNALVTEIYAKWQNAERTVIAPAAPTPEMVAWLAHSEPDEAYRPKPGTPRWEDEQKRLAAIERGRALFYSKTANCYSCHGDSQLGDGQTTDYDAWTQWRKDLDKSSAEDRAKMIAEFESLGALPPRNETPRDLRRGVYRGGRRPLDIFRRISSGINGTPMPQLKVIGIPADTKDGVPPEQVWDLVLYIKSLPYEPLSQPPAVLEGAIRKHQL